MEPYKVGDHIQFTVPLGLVPANLVSSNGSYEVLKPRECNGIYNGLIREKYNDGTYLVEFYDVKRVDDKFTFTCTGKNKLISEDVIYGMNSIKD